VVRNHKLARISAQSEILFLTFAESCHDGEGEEASERERAERREAGDRLNVSQPSREASALIITLQLLDSRVRRV